MAAVVLAVVTAILTARAGQLYWQPLPHDTAIGVIVP